MHCRDFLAWDHAEQPVVGKAHWHFYKLRDDSIMPVICPTCQNVFRKDRSTYPCQRHPPVSLHGVVFDILVGSEHPQASRLSFSVFSGPHTAAKLAPPYGIAISGFSKTFPSAIKRARS
jgi:hypothetical protein